MEKKIHIKPEDVSIPARITNLRSLIQWDNSSIPVNACVQGIGIRRLNFRKELPINSFQHFGNFTPEFQDGEEKFQNMNKEFAEVLLIQFCFIPDLAIDSIVQNKNIELKFFVFQYGENSRSKREIQGNLKRENCLRCSVKMVFLKIQQKIQQVLGLQLYRKRDSNTGVFL